VRGWFGPRLFERGWKARRGEDSSYRHLRKQFTEIKTITRRRRVGKQAEGKTIEVVRTLPSHQNPSGRVGETGIEYATHGSLATKWTANVAR